MGILADRFGAGKKSANRRLPFNTEMLEFRRGNLRADTAQGESELNRARTATLSGFMFLLRDSELDALELRDIAFGENENLEYVRISIMKSKNDQDEVGVVRSLNATNATICPVARMKMDISTCARTPRSVGLRRSHTSRRNAINQMGGSGSRFTFRSFFDPFHPRWMGRMPLPSLG